jgi:hypothetical protein
MASAHLPNSVAGPGTVGVSAPAGLVAEATKKAGLVWITATGTHRARPAWHHWQDAAAYVLTGGSEQALPELAQASQAEVTVPSKDSGGRLISWIAGVTRVVPGSEEWLRVIPELTSRRLNALDSANQADRWARECTLLRLEPTGEVTQAPGAMSEDAGAAPPEATPATTSGPLPFVLGRARRRRR